jgi:hypothetical protein
MRRLSDFEFARIALEQLSESERIEFCAGLLQGVETSGAHAELRDAAHKIARHADHLQRLHEAPRDRVGSAGPGSAPGQLARVAGPKPSGSFSMFGQRGWS